MIRLHELPPGFHVLKDVQEAGGFSIRDFRFGRLVPLAAVMGENGFHKQPRYILFQCDCGRRCKRGIVGIRRKGIPDTCGKKCRLGPLGVKKRPGGKPKHTRVYGAIDRNHPIWKATLDTWLQTKPRMCKRWQKSFDTFLQDMGFKPKGLTLCRKNRKLKHSPENTRWDYFGSDRSKIVWNGYPVTIKWFSETFGIPYFYVAKRSWDSKGILDCKDIIRTYHRYQARLKAKQQK